MTKATAKWCKNQTIERLHEAIVSYEMQIGLEKNAMTRSSLKERLQIVKEAIKARTVSIATAQAVAIELMEKCPS